MEDTAHRLPAPAVLVDCPWCMAPVEVEPSKAELTCAGCHVTVELAPPPSATTRRLAA